MFAEPIGNLLQLLALGMEFVGISLATIELRFPRIAAGLVAYQSDIVRTPADRVEGSPGDIERGRWLEASLKDIYLSKHLQENQRTNPMNGALIFIGFCWITGTLLALTVGSYSALLATNLSTLLLFYLLPVGIIVAVPLVIYLSARLVVFTRSFSQGRGIGTLGLLIAFAGLLLELYQVITVVLSDQPSIGDAPFSLKIVVGTAGMMLFVFAVYIAVVTRKITKV